MIDPQIFQQSTIIFLNFQVKQKAGEEIGQLAYVLTEEDRGKCVLTTVLTMAHDDLNEDNRIVAVHVNKFKIK